jgi:hypothetical protein
MRSAARRSDSAGAGRSEPEALARRSRTDFTPDARVATTCTGIVREHSGHALQGLARERAELDAVERVVGDVVQQEHEVGLARAEELDVRDRARGGLDVEVVTSGVDRAP